jgi:hypothetical protein
MRRVFFLERSDEAEVSRTRTWLAVGANGIVCVVGDVVLWRVRA